MNESERTKGERTRIAEQIKLMRGLLDGFEATAGMPGVPASESAQAVADAAIRLVSSAGRLDAYQLAEVDRRRSVLDKVIDRGTPRPSIQPAKLPPVTVSRPQFIGPGAPCPEGGGHAPNVMTRICRKCNQAV